MTPRKVTNGDQSEPHERSKDKRASTSLDDSCDPHECSKGKRDLFNDTSDVIIKISMCLGFFFLSLFFLSPLSSLQFVKRDERKEN
jgi:hypothetical protein